jgi:hypothetical protein
MAEYSIQLHNDIGIENLTKNLYSANPEYVMSTDIAGDFLTEHWSTEFQYMTSEEVIEAYEHFSTTEDFYVLF